MNLNRGSSIVSLTLLIVLATTSVFAGVPLVTSYQGRLLDAGDQPLTGSYTMIFQIYDVPVGGAPLWTEDHVGVSVTDGLFSVALGATVPMTAELLTGSGGGGGGGAGGSRYLQIQIAGQPPISPRTRLSAAPYAVASGSVSGDITTIPGGAIISNALGTRGLSLRATNDSAGIAIDEEGVQRVKISGSGGSGGGSGGMISITGDPDFDLLRLTTTQDSAKIRISGQSIGDPDFDLLRIVAGKGASDGGMISITGDPDFDLLRMSAGKDSAKIRISGQSSGDPDFDLLRIVGGTGTGTAGASVTITGDPDFDLLRMSADHDSAKIRLGGKITGDPDFDLLRLAGGSGGSQLHMQSEPSGVDAQSQSIDGTCDNTNARLAIKTKGTSAHREIKASTDSDSATILMTGDDDGDGVPETSVSQSSNSDGAGVSLKTRIDSTPARISTNFTVSKQSQGADFGQRYDSDGDGTPEQEISSAIVPTKSQHAVNTKGTGAQVGRVVSVTSSTEVDSALEVCSMDLDGDGVNENEASMTVTPTTSGVAIKTKGTGADANKTASLTVTGSPGGHVSSIGVADTDGDGTNDEEISQIITPTTSGVAIKTKGTGADKDRIASVSSTTGFLIAGTASVVDNDGDGVPESEISQSVTPTTSNVAIKTKGTGADKDRVISSTTDTAKAVTVHSADLDGDGVADRVIREQCDDDDASITVARGSSEIKIRHKGWDGTIKGRMAIESSGAIQVDFAGDGVGFVSQRFGIGVLSPTHPFEHSSGAHLTAGGVWTNASDANLKENFQPVDGQELLEKIAELPISQWNYKSESNQVKHIGPTAQDFQEVFGVGSDGKSISTIDPAGIALAAAKELSARLSQKTEQIDQLESEVRQLRALVERLLAEKK